MKHLLIFLLLSCGVSLAQVNGFAVGNGYVWNDSLTTYHDSSGGSFYQVTDSVNIIRLGYNYSFVSITIEDTGSVYTDSLKIYKGVRVYNNANVLQDTLWCDLPLPVKLNDWTSTDTVLAGAGQIKTYIILENNLDLLKVAYKNTGDAFISGARTRYAIEATKQK